MYAVVMFSVLVLWTTKKVFCDCIVILMERRPSDFDSQTLLINLRSLRGFVGVENLQVWAIARGQHSLNIRLLYDPSVLQSSLEVDAMLGAAQRIRGAIDNVENVVVELRASTIAAKENGSAGGPERRVYVRNVLPDPELVQVSAIPHAPSTPPSSDHAAKYRLARDESPDALHSLLQRERDQMRLSLRPALPSQDAVEKAMQQARLSK